MLHTFAGTRGRAGGGVEQVFDVHFQTENMGGEEREGLLGVERIAGDGYRLIDLGAGGADNKKEHGRPNSRANESILIDISLVCCLPVSGGGAA